MPVVQLPEVYTQTGQMASVKIEVVYSKKKRRSLWRVIWYELFVPKPVEAYRYSKSLPLAPPLTNSEIEQRSARGRASTRKLERDTEPIPVSS